MKRFFIFLLVLVLIFTLAALNSQRPKVIISRLLDKEAPKKESKYIVSLFGIIPAGEAVFFNESLEDYAADNDSKIYHLSAAAKNLKIYSKFIQAAAALDSYLDTHSLNPYFFKQTLSISGKNDVIKEVSYDQENHIMTIAGERREIMPDTQDPLSAIFKIKRMDFSKIKNFEMNINTNQKNYTLKGTAQIKDLVIRGKANKIAIINADISRRQKSPYHKTNIRMVLWQDRQNLPVYIKIFASGFLLTVKLVDIK